jgi:cytochrome c oxidase subunit 3
MTTSSTITAEYRKKLATNRLGLWLFLISDSFVFGGLLITRFYLLGTGHRPDVNPLVGVTVTAVLLLSSFFMNRAEIAMAFGDSRTFQFSILITLSFGFLYHDRISCFSRLERTTVPCSYFSQWSKRFV